MSATDLLESGSKLINKVKSFPVFTRIRDFFRNFTPQFYMITKTNKIMEAKEQVLKAMREAGEPLNAGKVAELTGLDRKVVDKAFAELKKEGAIVSPVRCKWAPAE